MNTRGRSRALVVDDQAMVVLEIEDILVERGFEVISVSTLASLEQAIASGPYAVIVSDTDFASHLEMQKWGAGKIVICSGKARAELEAEFPGMAIVTKPFLAEDLLAVLPVS